MNTLSKEYVQQLLAKTTEITAVADRDGCRCLNLDKDFVAVPVHYMEGAPNHLWELGFVPRQVSYDGSTISSNEVFLYNAGSRRIRGPNDCVFSQGQWERYPD